LLLSPLDVGGKRKSSPNKKTPYILLDRRWNFMENETEMLDRSGIIQI